MDSIKITRKQAKPILDLTFPGYKGRKIEVSPTTRACFYNLNWSGGSKNEYVAIRADGVIARVPAGSPWACPTEGLRVDLPEHIIIVERTYYCGKDLGITIHVHPNNLPKCLPIAS